MSTEEANKLVRSQIRNNPKQPGLFSNLNVNEMTRMVLDEYDPVLRLQKLVTGAKTNKEAIEAIPAAYNPYVLMRNLKGVVGKAIVATQYETFDYRTFKKNGESLAAILKPYKKDVEAGQGLENFMAAARALELGKSGRESGFANSPEMAVATRKAYEAGKEKYGKDAKRIVEYQRRILKYLVDSGVKSEKEYNAMLEKGEHYIPFKRVIEGDNKNGISKSLTVKDPKSKQLKGSELAIYSPIESIVNDTHEIIAMAERNRVMRALRNLVGDDSDLMEKVGVDSGKEVTLENGEKAIQYSKLNDNEIGVYEGGERTVFKVSEEVAAAISGMDSATMGLFTKIAAKTATGLRAGVTLDPFFTARNVMRDQLHAFVMSNNGYIPIVDFVAGAFSLVKKDKAFVEWAKGGGMAATIQNIDRNYIQSNIQKLAKDTGFLKQAGNVVSTPVKMFQVLRAISEAGELPTRLGEFKKATRGNTDINTTIAGAFDARNVTLDFQKRGAKTAAINAITPFFNAKIQGNYQLYQALKEQPVKTVMKGAVMSTASILLWAATRDDERLKEIPDWVKASFWVVPTDEWIPAEEGEEGNPNSRQLADGSWETNVGAIYKIPKPQELGMIFGSAVEALLESFEKEDPKAAIDMSKQILAQYAIADLPTAAKVPLELITNHNFFTGDPIVDHFTEQNVSHLQYASNTSEAAKFLAKAMYENGVDQGYIPSPAKMDHAVRGALGTLGTYGVAGVSHAIQLLGGDVDKEMGAKEWADISYVRAFQVKLPKAAKSVNEFYEIYKEKISRWPQSMKTLEKTGSDEDIIKMSENPDYQIAEALKGDFKSALSSFKEIKGAVAGINSIPDEEMSKDEKSRAIDALLWKRAAIARELVLTYETYKKEVGNGVSPDEIIIDDNDEENEE